MIPYVDTKGFGWALEQLLLGNKVTRANRDGEGQYCQLQVPDANSKMTLPYIYIRTTGGNLVPWSPSQTDILALDWHLAEVKP